MDEKWLKSHSDKIDIRVRCAHNLYFFWDRFKYIGKIASPAHGYCFRYDILLNFNFSEVSWFRIYQLSETIISQIKALHLSKFVFRFSDC